MTVKLRFEVATLRPEYKCQECTEQGVLGLSIDKYERYRVQV